MTARRSRLLPIVLLLVLAPSAAAQGPSGLAVYGGIFDTQENERPTELGLEYRFAALKVPKVALKPAVGIAGTDDGNAWVYGGLRLDLKIGLGWIVTPQFAAALYEDGDGKDLGGVLEFRSGLEVARRFVKGPRLGVLFYHLSNAGFYDRNPGTNSLVLTLSFGR